MENKSGISFVSLPFAAGVASGAIAGVPFEGAIASSLASVCCIYISIAKGSRRPAAMAALYFCLGVMCWCTRALCPAPTPPHDSTALNKLACMIEDAGFPGEHSASILQALLTGRRNLLAPATKAAFRKSGASHILALSGLHLGVLYVFVKRLLSPLGNSRCAQVIKSIITIALSSFYASATGASPSIVRALLFIIISEAGRLFTHRARTPLGTYCTALTIQLCIRPDFIATAGFQLSYLAMLGITVLYPRLESWFPPTRLPLASRYIWKCAALSISCQLFTAPVVWLHFRTFPTYFLITNLIAMPLTELIITTAVTVLLLNAAGICPQFLVTAAGEMVKVLEFCLNAIASI